MFRSPAMKRMRLAVFALIILSSPSLFAQSPAGQYDPMGSIAGDLNKIAASVQTLSERLKSFIDKFEKAPGLTITDKQNNLIIGLQVLASSEQLLASRQRTQIELVEKQGTTRTRLAQVERDVMPHSIDRSVAFEGTTKTEELRENRRSTLQAERVALQAVLAQITSNLADQSEAVREMQIIVQRLRKQLIPQIEREISEY